jgi:DnaJ-like protein
MSRSSIDPIARAYATIGLRPGASASELKQQYKRLVKQWHPDRWAGDPVNQAEAAQRMRVINDAYATLHRWADAGAHQAPVSVPPSQPPHWSSSHRSMTDEEIDAIVSAIGTRSPVNSLLSFLTWFLPMVAAFITIAPSRGGPPPTTQAWVAAAVLFSTGVAILIFQKLKGRRGR